jgi:uncharacterized protein
MPEEFDGQEREYLGTGLAFPLQSSLQGGLKLSSDAQKVKESIWIILRTSLGERVYRPNFGSRLSELVFEPLNSATLIQIRLYVLEALEVWEPRIEIDRVETEADPIRGLVNIIVYYYLKDYPDTHSFVYPFYLLSGAQ